MMDPKNVTNQTGGLVADPELIDSANGKIVKLRFAVDFAGQERDSDNRSGYFDVTYYANDSNPNSKFILSQIEKGNFKKGSQLQIVGRLVQERWKKDDKNGSRVVIVAEGITYAGGGSSQSKPADSTTSNDAPASLPTSF